MRNDKMYQLRLEYDVSSKLIIQYLMTLYIAAKVEVGASMSVLQEVGYIYLFTC